MNTTKLENGRAGNDRFGWHVQWRDGQGFRSAMPNRETAMVAAAAPEMAKALKQAVQMLEHYERNRVAHGNLQLIGLREAIDNARAILSKIGGAE